MRNIFIVMLILKCTLLNGQSADSTYAKVYKTNPALEIALPSAFFIGSFFLFKEVDKQANMTEADVLKLDPQSINSFDRPIAFYNPANFQNAQDLSYTYMDIAIISPVFLMLDKKIRHDWRDIASLFLVAHAVDNSIYFATQFSVRRARPLTYNPAVPLEEKIGEGKSSSFFSGHTSWAATSTFLLAKIYTDYHQIKGIKRLLIYTGAAIPPAIVGYYRLEAGKHFKTDVISALIIGAACGIGVPELHRIKNKDNSFSFRPFMMQGASGISLTYAIK